MDNPYVTLVETTQDGVNYQLVARKVDPKALDALGPESGPLGGALLQELKVIARKAE